MNPLDLSIFCDLTVIALLKTYNLGLLWQFFFIIFFLTVPGQKSNPATPSLANEAKKAVFLRNNTIRDRLRLHNLYLQQHLINIIFMNFIYSFQYMHVYHFIKFWIGNFTSEIGFSKVCSLVPRIHKCKNNNLSNSYNKFHILRQTMKYHLFINCDFLVVQFYKKWTFCQF